MARHVEILIVVVLVPFGVTLRQKGLNMVGIDGSSHNVLEFDSLLATVGVLPLAITGIEFTRLHSSDVALMSNGSAMSAE